MSQSSWLVGGILPGIERQPRKKLEPSPERPIYTTFRGRSRPSPPGARRRPRELETAAASRSPHNASRSDQTGTPPLQRPAREWQWLVRHEGHDVAEGAAPAADAKPEAEAVAIKLETLCDAAPPPPPSDLRPAVG